MNYKAIKRYLREPINSLTHGLGVIAAVAGLALILWIFAGGFLIKIPANIS